VREVKFYIGSITLIIFYSCQKPIDIKATTTNANILVVEGLINVQTDSTKIKLSRTVVIGNKTTTNPEGLATVSIETAQGTVVTLKEIAKGTYVTPILNLDKTKQYRLRIRLANGKIYLSDLTDVKVTPPIDSVGYTFKNNGIQLYVNTHDDTNNSRYYLYNYAETWRFDAKYNSNWVTNGASLAIRKPEQYVNECFGTGELFNIILNSTTALSQDVTYQFPIVFIEGTSEKIGIKYTILVTQTALTKEAYAFWENLKKSNELGSIFDSQPSQLIGNVHNVADASEPVIGYISAGTIQTKRIYINKSELPSTFKTEYPYSCRIDSVGGVDIFTLLVPLSTRYATLGKGDEGKYGFSDKPCADCTVRGTVKKPAFWQ
jgi:hypothetical protein